MQPQPRKAAEPETAAPAQEPIPFRSDLRELKRKLIAGPEKRYYELSDQGVFSLQIAIVLNLLVVAFCAGSAVMFSMGMVPDNRLRFVIFTQVLAMFISALLGCHQLLDGLGELLHGRFTINTFLSFTLIACCVDAYYCLQELRVPCCSGFALQMTFALFGPVSPPFHGDPANGHAAQGHPSAQHCQRKGLYRRKAPSCCGGKAM